MAFNANFSITPPGVDTTTFSLTDTSTGSDTNLTDRRIFLVQSNGNNLNFPNATTPYIDWPLSAGATITLTGILPIDYSLNIVVNWISSAPLAPPSTYTQNTLYTFTSNIMLFYYSLTELASANPPLINDNNYFPNKQKLKVYIEDAIDATQYNNQFSAQLALNGAYNMQLNRNTLF